MNAQKLLIICTTYLLLCAPKMQAKTFNENSSPTPPAASPQTKSSSAEKTNNQPNDYADNLKNFHKWLFMPMKVYIDSGEKVPSYHDSYRQMLIEAFDAWSQASHGRVTWKLLQKKGQANVICSWTDDQRKLGGRKEGITESYGPIINNVFYKSDSAMTLCLVDPITGRHLDDDEINTLCLHEVGHALGLMGHSPDPHDVMFYATQGHASPQHLSIRDINTLNLIYAGR